MATCLALYPKHDVADIRKSIFLIWSMTEYDYDSRLAIAYATVHYQHYYAEVVIVPRQDIENDAYAAQHCLRKCWLKLMSPNTTPAS